MGAVEGQRSRISVPAEDRDGVAVLMGAEEPIFRRIECEKAGGLAPARNLLHLRECSVLGVNTKRCKDVGRPCAGVQKAAIAGASNFGASAGPRSIRVRWQNAHDTTWDRLDGRVGAL